MESLVRLRKRICLSQCGLLTQILTVPQLTAPRVVLDRVLKTNTSSDTLCTIAFRDRVKVLGSCEHGPFMTAFKAHTHLMLGRPDRTLECPTREVPATQLLRDPIQEIQGRFSASTMLPILADASSSLQSEVLTPVVQLQSNVVLLRPLADFWAAWKSLPNVSQCVLLKFYSLDIRTAHGSRVLSV